MKALNRKIIDNNSNINAAFEAVFHRYINTSIFNYYAFFHLIVAIVHTSIQRLILKRAHIELFVVFFFSLFRLLEWRGKKWEYFLFKKVSCLYSIVVYIFWTNNIYT